MERGGRAGSAWELLRPSRLRWAEPGVGWGGGLLLDGQVTASGAMQAPDVGSSRGRKGLWVDSPQRLRGGLSWPLCLPGTGEACGRRGSGTGQQSAG